jgi:hypothetical protein
MTVCIWQGILRVLLVADLWEPTNGYGEVSILIQALVTGQKCVGRFPGSLLDAPGVKSFVVQFRFPQSRSVRFEYFLLVLFSVAGGCKKQ